jgi:hypothetical protein
MNLLLCRDGFRGLVGGSAPNLIEVTHRIKIIIYFYFVRYISPLIYQFQCSNDIYLRLHLSILKFCLFPVTVVASRYQVPTRVCKLQNSRQLDDPILDPTWNPKWPDTRWLDTWPDLTWYDPRPKMTRH